MCSIKKDGIDSLENLAIFVELKLLMKMCFSELILQIGHFRAGKV